MENIRDKLKEFSHRLDGELRDKRFRPDFIARFVVIWTLLSRIPLPRKLWPEVMPEGHRSLALAPLVGAILGLFNGLVVTLAGFSGLNGLAAAWIGAAFYFLAGWALHLDGWGDLWDGIGSGRSGEELRAIMKDSRLGSFGGASLVLAFGLWTSALASIPAGERIAACVICSAAARFSENIAAFFGEYPWEVGMSKGWVDDYELYDLFIASLCTLITIVFAPLHFIVSVISAALFGYLAAVYMNKKLGGVNGDVMGACAVASELLSLILWVIL